MKILVNMYDQLLVNGEPMQNVRMLKERTKEFIANPTNDIHMPEKEPKLIPELGETVMVSKGIISLQNDRSTSYKMYIAVQNQLAQAFNELRNEYAQEHYGKSFENLDEVTKKGVQTVIPISISEAEPSNYGGGQK